MALPRRETPRRGWARARLYAQCVFLRYWLRARGRAALGCALLVVALLGFVLAVSVAGAREGPGAGRIRARGKK